MHSRPPTAPKPSPHEYVGDEVPADWAGTQAWPVALHTSAALRPAGGSGHPRAAVEGNETAVGGTVGRESDSAADDGQWWLCSGAAGRLGGEFTLRQCLRAGREAGADVLIAFGGSAGRRGAAGLLGPVVRSVLGLGMGARRHDSLGEMASGGLLLVREATLTHGNPGPLGVRALSAMLRRRPSVCVVDLEARAVAGEHGAQARPASGVEAVACVLVLWLSLFGDRARQLALFLLIGASAMVLNSLVTAFGRVVLGLHYLAAAVVATEVTSLCCFCLLEAGVFPDRRSARGRGARLLCFLAMNNGALLLRGPMMYALTSVLGVHYLLSNAASIGAFTLVRYGLSAFWIWGQPRASRKVSDRPARGGGRVGSEAKERRPGSALLGATAPSRLAGVAASGRDDPGRRDEALALRR